jgi:hypothetical protein
MKILDNKEKLYALRDAVALFPTECTLDSIKRWVRKGSRGVILETVYFKGKNWTSKEAINRFMENIQEKEKHKQPTIEPLKGRLTQEQLQERAKALGLQLQEKNQCLSF